MALAKSITILSAFLFICTFYLVAGTFEKDTSYTTFQTWQKIKKKYPEIKIVSAIQDSNLISNENVVYKTIFSGNGTQRDLHLDIFRPAQKGKYPALVMIHGGGWRSGNKSMQKPMAQHVSLEGYTTIAVEYRLSLEAKYPAAIHDIKAAIRWIKDNSEQYGIDTTKITIEGESAGGQLAMLVAMTNNVEKFEGDKNGSRSSSTVHAAIDVDGVVDFLAPNSLNTLRKPDSPDAFWLGGIFEEIPLVWKDASPIYWVGKNSVPVLFITSSVPRFHAGRDEMIDLLNQNGIYSESHSIADSPHSFWLFDPWFEPTKEYIIQFLKKYFK
jgi:pectinesterase